MHFFIFFTIINKIKINDENLRRILDFNWVCALLYILIKMSERGNGIVNSWLDLLNPYPVAV